MQRLTESVTVVIRTVGERTTALGRSLLEKLFPAEQIHEVSVRPFSQSVLATFTLGLNEGRKWTLVLDADVLPRMSAIVDLLVFAEGLPEHTFVVKGIVFDKLLHALRPAGVHLYRTNNCDEARHNIPSSGASLRPESDTVKTMVNLGFLAVQYDEILGLHDFEQDYVDLARKALLHARKHDTLINHARNFWVKREHLDSDFKAALVGYELSAAHPGAVYVDSGFLINEIQDSVEKVGLSSRKPPLQPGVLDNEELINRFIFELLLDPLTADIQEIVQSPDRWNRIEGHDSEAYLVIPARYRKLHKVEALRNTLVTSGDKDGAFYEHRNALDFALIDLVEKISRNTQKKLRRQDRLIAKIKDDRSQTEERLRAEITLLQEQYSRIKERYCDLEKAYHVSKIKRQQAEEAYQKTKVALKSSES